MGKSVASAWISVLALAGLFAIGCGGSSSGGGSGASGGAGGAGGAGGGGTGGSGGAPQLTDKVDLLLMVDNSMSMTDKQELLAEAVPRLVNQLINPTGGGKAVTDLHIGIVSSSLGGHGGDQCSEQSSYFTPSQNDHAHLMPSVRPSASLPSHQGLGFLWWDPGNKGGGQSNSATLTAELTAHVKAVGEGGCGWESSLEAWYRFLIDPSPPEQVVVQNNVAGVIGTDAVVLKQRQDFLRPDSAVVVLMLSDENDCSTIDGGYNWIAAQTSNPNNTAFHLPRATSACATDPNSPCCRSCATSEASTPPGCASVSQDPTCQMGSYDDKGDHPNLRCWQQRKRFGLDFLYPTRKYAEALTQPTVCSSWLAPPSSSTALANGECGGARVANPLFAGGRDPGLVFLVGIVGVPWQDLATDATLSAPSELALLDASELAAKARWDWLVPSCLEPVSPAELERPMPICKRWDAADEPDDPFMIESSKPRSGKHPVTGESIAPPNAGSMASKINGHDWQTNDGDLQYACIFPLPAPKDCSQTPAGCDCDDVGGGYTAMNPLCQDSSGQYSTQQLFAKAFPGTRHLQVMKDIGSQAVVASICAKSSASPSSSAYGYNAAMDALAKRLYPVLK